MKIARSHRRTLALFACTLVLWLLVSQANHYLARWQVYLWIGGLFVTFAGLRLAPQEGFGASFLAGLLLDAVSPVPLGLQAFLFGITHLILVRLRHRLAVEETVVAVSVALLANLGLFLAFSFLRLRDLVPAGSAGVRLLADLAVSQCVLALLAPWYFALQQRALELGGAGLRSEPAPTM